MPHRWTMRTIRQYKGVFIAATVLAGLIGVICLLVVLMIRQETRDRERDAETRVEVRLFFCEENEKQKALDRAQAFRSLAELPATLEALGIPYTTQLESLAQDNYKRELEALQPIPGGCQKFAEGDVEYLKRVTGQVEEE